MKMGNNMKMKRVFVPNPQYRFDPENLRQIADEIVYVCQSPMFDDLAGAENMHRFEGRIADAMSDFNPDGDIIAYYGDAVIFAMMVLFVFCIVCPKNDTITIARVSQKTGSYVLREISPNNFGELL